MARVANNRAKEAYIKSVEEDLSDVPRNGNIRKIGGGTSGLVTEVDEPVNQSLYRDK